MIKDLIDKIYQLGPDIIFVEKGVNQAAVEFLIEKQITVVSQIKNNILRKIIKATKASSFKNFDRLTQYDPDKVLGRCKSIEFLDFESN